MTTMTIYKSFGILILTAFMLLSGVQAGAAEKRWKVINDTLILKEAESAMLEKEKRDTSAKADGENLFYANEWIKSWFSRLDQNGDKRIDLIEFNDNTAALSVDKNDLSVFQKGEANPDGVLSLFEFKNFIDTTDILTQQEMAKQAAPIIDEANDLDPLKLVAGIFAITLLMAAFKLV